MIKVDFIVLEDGLEYAIIDEIIINNIKFIYLVQENNSVELRKLDEEENLIKVNSDECNKVMLEFAKKHKNDLVNL